MSSINGVSYTFVAKKLASGSWEIEKIGTSTGTTNTAPVFTDGTSTTRSVAENTIARTNIGTAIAATDADNDTLTYTLGGTDAASFGIVSTSGQLQTKAALDYETKTSYSVTITVSDGNSGSDSITVTINVTDVLETIIISPRFVPVADRTPEVRDAIVAAVPNVTDAAKVTKAQVAAITSLNLRNAGITALKAGDFSGMTALTSLNLYNNQLSSLPNGIFEGLTSLTTVRLGRNAVDPLPFIVSLEKVADGEFKAVAPAVALFNIVLHITVTNGSVTGGATTVTIPRGSMVSDTLAVTRTAGTTAHVTVDIEAFPNLPRNHYGYTLAKSGNLPLIIIRGTNTAPVFTNGSSTTRSVAENTAPNTNIGSPVSATDADRDTLTYSLGSLGGPIGLSGTDAAAFRIVGTSGQLQTKAALDYETKSSYSFTVSVADGNGGTDSITVTINVTDVTETPVNRAPVFTDGNSTTRSIAENTAANTNIGTAITATDADNDTLTYSLGGPIGLSGTDAAAFRIVSTSGQLQTKAALDYETKSSYTVTVSVSDGNGGTDSITVTINITDIDETVPNRAPVFTEGSTATRSVAENTAAGQHIGTAVAATDADGNTLAYTLGGTDAAAFGIDRTTGQLKTKAALDYETKTTYTVTVSVSDGNGGTDSITVTINVTDVTEPSTPQPPTTPVESDYDHIQGPWLWMIAPGGNIDTDNLSNASDGVITETQIAQNGVNEDENFNQLQWTSGSILPTTVCGIFLCSSDNVINVVRQIGLTDASQLHRYSAYALINISSPRDQNNVLMGVGSDDSIKVWLNGSVVYINDTTRRTTGIQNRFNVNLNAGNNLLLIKVCNNGSWVGNDDWGMFFKIYLDTQDYTISLPMRDSENTAPVFTEGSSTTRSIAENTAAGLHIGTAVTATDADSNTLAYTLGGIDAAAFGIDRTTGQLKTKAALDYETKTTYTVTVSVGDGNGGRDSITVTINITDIDETVPNRAPVFTEGSTATRSVAENTAAGQHIGTAVAATDADGNTLAYTLGGTDAASFGIDRTTGHLKTSAALDYETKSTYTVTVTVSDGTSTDTITVTINVTDVDERQQQQIAAVCQVGDILDPGESCTYPDTDAVFSVQNDGTSRWNIPNLPPLLQWINKVSIGGSMSVSTTVNGVYYHIVAEQTGSSWEIKEIGDQGVQEPETPGGTPTPTPTNNAPVFSAGTSTTRSVAENTTSGTNIGSAISATDADNDTLTYTLGGTDASSFSIVSTSGQLQTSTALDYETKNSYSVTVSVSDGNGGSDSITVTINITNVTETSTSTLTVSTSSTLTEATLHENVVTLTLSNGSYVRSIFDIRDAVSVSGITGVTFPWHDPDRSSDTVLTLKLEFDGDMTTNGTLTFTVGADAIQNYSGSELTATISVSATTESITASTSSALTETTLDGAKVTLTLSGRKFERSIFDIRDAVSVSGISGVAFPWYHPRRKSDTVLTLDLEFDGDMTQNGTLTFTVGADAIAGYNGADLTAQINVTATGGTTTPTPTNNAPVFSAGTSTTRSVAENTASGTNIGSAVSATDSDNDTLTYTLSGTDASSFSIVSTSGQLQTSAALDYETKTSYSVTVSVSDGNGGSDSITVTINVTDVNENAANNAPVFSDGTTATRSVAENTASGTNIGTAVSATDSDNDTLTYTLGGTDASSFSIVSTSGQLQTSTALDYETKNSYSVTVSVSDGNGGSDSITVTINITNVTETSTATLSITSSSSLTEATLHGAVISLNLSGYTFERAFWDLDDEISVSGITGVSYDDFFDVDRISSTEVQIELSFDGNMTEDGTLTFTVSSGAIVGYTGADLTAQISVSSVTESISVSPTTITEANLDGTEVTLTLSGRKFERSIFDIRDEVSVSGITGVTFPWYHPRRKSDTVLTLDLEFDGDMTQNGTLTFTVGADAIAGYNGSDFTAQVTVTASGGSGLGANFPNPFNPETWIPYQLAKDVNVTLTIYDMRGVVVRELKLGHKPAGVYTSRSRAIYWDGKNEFGEPVASGVYFYMLKAGDFTATRKMLIRK